MPSFHPARERRLTQSPFHKMTIMNQKYKATYSRRRQLCVHRPWYPCRPHHLPADVNSPCNRIGRPQKALYLHPVFNKPHNIAKKRHSQNMHAPEGHQQTSIKQRIFLMCIQKKSIFRPILSSHMKTEDIYRGGRVICDTITIKTNKLGRQAYKGI